MRIKSRMSYILIIILFVAIVVQFGRSGQFNQIFSLRQSNEQAQQETINSIVPNEYQSIVVLYSLADEGSRLLYDNVLNTFDMARLNYKMIDISSTEISSELIGLSGEDLLVIATENLNEMSDPSAVIEFIGDGGRAVFLIRSYYPEFDDMLGIEENEVFFTDDVYGFEFVKPFFPGLDEIKIKNGKISHSILDVKLSEDIEIVAHANGNIPIIWTKEYKEGKLLYVNSTFLMDKANRGVLLNTLSYIGDYFLATIFNGKIVNIDDFPAPIKFGEDETIFEQYHMDNKSFYRYIWWSSLSNLAERFDLKYTGLIIGTYNLDTQLPLMPFYELEIEDIEFFGRKLNEVRGELGIHGYNHNSLALEEGIDFENYGYTPWESLTAMETGLQQLKDQIEKLFGDIKIHTYVAPSNLITADGKLAVKNVFEDVEVFAGVYTGDEEKGLLIQEFGPDPDIEGVYDFPRLSAGYEYSQDLMWDIYNGIGHFGIVNHFIHPDDLLDPERSKGMKWNKLDQNLNNIFSDIYERFPFLNAYTNKEAIDAYKNYENVKVYVHRVDDVITIDYETMVPPLSHYVYLKDKNIATIDGGEFLVIDQEMGLYLVISNQERVTIKLK